VLTYIDKGCKFGAFWTGTGEDLIIKILLLNASMKVKDDYLNLLRDGVLKKTITTSVTLKELKNSTNPDDFWSFLFSSGYLTFETHEQNIDKWETTLKIPNLDVKYGLSELVKSWYQKPGNPCYTEMMTALTDGNESAFKVQFPKCVLENLSFFDIGEAQPENVYHVFLMGLLCGIGG